MSDPNQLAGKVAVVTGAGGAIGAATALLMLARGASVVAVDRTEAALAQLERDAGPGASLHLAAADVASEAAVAGYVQEARKAFGRIDVFFNNAGIEGDV